MTDESSERNSIRQMIDQNHMHDLVWDCTFISLPIFFHSACLFWPAYLFGTPEYQLYLTLKVQQICSQNQVSLSFTWEVA